MEDWIQIQSICSGARNMIELRNQKSKCLDKPMCGRRINRHLTLVFFYFSFPGHFKVYAACARIRGAKVRLALTTLAHRRLKEHSDNVISQEHIMYYDHNP